LINTKLENIIFVSYDTKIIKHGNIIMDENSKPTLDMYKFVQIAYDWFNERLFDKQLSPCIITFQREKNTCGYYSPARWKGETHSVDEIALNPNFFITIRPLELMQTIVHEMCHKWQHDHGTASRSGYHNWEWANKMESIGLIPSSTGRIGGRKTGQKMSDYPQTNGAFEIACKMLANSGHKLPYIDRKTGLYQPSNMLDKNILELTGNTELIITSPFAEQFEISLGNANLNLASQVLPSNKNKIKYTCPSCKTNVWGKSDLKIKCVPCDLVFLAKIEEKQNLGDFI
jgi:predicted SprT family Zn-dependent metalloprotease